MGSSFELSPQLIRFGRQYLQLERSPRYPDGSVLRCEQAQAYLYETLFKPGAVPYPPPIRYRLRVLKELLSRIEQSIDNWEDFVSLMRHTLHRF
jgi:hypothetical protein